MQPSQNPQARINLSELKGQIVKKLGPEQSRRYFSYLNRLLSCKLSKAEFDKLCIRTVGRENLPLHNQLIRGILKNVCHAKVPPPTTREDEAPLKSTESGEKHSSLGENGYQQSGSSLTSGPGPTPLIWSNGDVLPMSPRKCRSGGRERRIRDRPSPLGPNGKMEVMSHISPALGDGSVKIVTENGDVNLCDFQRPVQRYEELAEQPGNEQDSLLQRPTKRLRSKKSPDDSISVHSKGHGEAVTIEDREGMQQSGNSNTARHPIHAPLGIPFCSASVGGTRRVLPSYNSSGFILSSESGVIFDTETLRRRMEQIVEAQGLGRVSLDCANLLNNGLDVYLKRLIRSCIELVGSRFGHEPQKQPVHGQQPHGLLNGIWPGHQLQMQSCGEPVEGMQERRTSCPISLLDFKVAMELNPQQLGEDWPLLLEKICMRACEE